MKLLFQTNSPIPASESSPVRSKTKTSTALPSPGNLRGLKISTVALSQKMIHPPHGVWARLRPCRNAAWLYNSVVARRDSRQISRGASKEASANPSNDDFLLGKFLLASHRLTTRDDPFLPLLCLRVHFHHFSDLLHCHLLLWPCGEEH